jgi:MFS family permease
VTESVHGTATGVPEEGAGRAWQILAVTSVTVLLIFVMASGLNIALPAMVRDLHPTPAQSSWFLLSYMFTTTAFILVFGRLGDILGRRRLYLAGILVLMLGTLASGLAPDPALFITCRLVQGIGAAAVITTNTPILTDVFPDRLLSTGLGANVTVAALGQLLGPAIGGVIADSLGWRWLFLGAAPLMLVGLLISVRLIPRSPHRSPHERMDVPGSVFATLGIGALALAANDYSTFADATRVTFWGGAVTAVVCLSGLLVVQRRSRHPLVDPAILDPATLRLYGAGFAVAFANYAVVVVVSLYLQAALGLSATNAAVLLLPAPAGTTLAAFVAGRLVRRHDPARVAAVGSALIAVGTVAVALALPYGALAGIAVGLFLTGFGTGVFMTPNTSELMTTVPPTRRGIGNAVRSTLQNAGYLFSTAVSLGLATVLLSPEDRVSAYRGTLAADGGDLSAFAGSTVIALAVLFTSAVLGCIASASVRQARRRG